MLNPDLYIHGTGYIAPDADPQEAVIRLSAREPDYSGVIPPMQLRRMSKAVRMGIGAARACLDEGGGIRPDAIAVGTTMGCLQDTEVFLNKLVSQEERMLTPTSFIQSTHNTVAGQIALLTGCQGFNTTISQRGHSVEGAVISAALYLGEHPEHSVLCGGVDELTDTSFMLYQRSGVYTQTPFVPGELRSGGHSGSIAGEGAGFMLLSRQADASLARISGLHLFSGKDIPVALTQVWQCLSDAGADPGTDDLWLGASGDPHRDNVYDAIAKYWTGTPVCFKEQTGEWGTVIATALCRAVQAWPEGKRRIWLINHLGRDWSIWLLER